MPLTSDRKKLYVSLWLMALCAQVILILVVGGLTRLTHSGLSMVNWQPLIGIIPPLNEKEWLDVFRLYQNFPQFQLVNHKMSLLEFKEIFLWEYAHRVLARSVGILFLLPWLFFWLKGWITSRFAAISFIGFVLGGLQGLLGWFMVQSGLVFRPSVSHFRLAAHFSLALFIFSFFFWLLLKQNTSLPKIKARRPLSLSLLTGSLFSFLVLQIVYGAFVAGLKAGKIYNTFPKMAHHWFPPEALALSPNWINFFENWAAIQFSHRTIAWIIIAHVISIAILWHKKFRHIRLQKPLSWLIFALTTQFYLGVFTLINKVPIALASLHQLGAVFLLSTMIYFVFCYLGSTAQSSELNQEP